MDLRFKHQSLDIKNGHYAVFTNLHIHKLNPELEKIKAESLQKALSYNDEEIELSPVNQGYREILEEFNYPKLVPAGENFVRMLRKRNKFPTINTAVDAYNCSVVDTFLAIGAHDMSKIEGDITFNFAHEGESIPAVNMNDAFQVKSGDYVYRDEEKILAWLDVRDTDLAKIEKSTKNMVLIVEGNRKTSSEYINNALQNACVLVQRFCGGSFKISELE